MWQNKGFHMRWLSRDLEEQINSIKRELDNLEELGILKSRTELKKKIFIVNNHFPLVWEFSNIFLRTYNPFEKIKAYFKTQTLLELVLVNESVKSKLADPWKAILDIFMIWEINKDELNAFLESVFYGKKIKYAIITTEDFFNRLEYWDKLIKNILTEKWNIYLKDNLKIKEKVN